MDNILILTRSDSLITATKDAIKKTFKVKDSRPVRRILDIEIYRKGLIIIIKQS